MLINPDYVKHMHEEYERRVARFQLERQLDKARRASTKAKSGSLGKSMRLFTRLTVTLWCHIGCNVGGLYRAEDNCATRSGVEPQPNA
ncbi:MAG: hypothetical protein R3E79_50690 [Caldilineaceae bacterium]